MPDKLYNLEILQYDSNGNYITKRTFGSETTLGTALTVNLSPQDGCQLLIVARGSGNAISTIATDKSLNDVRNTIATSSIIEAIDPSTGSLNTMPYLLHLEHVNVVSDNSGGTVRYVLQSPEGTYDTRLRLKRLATKLTVNWTFSSSLTDAGYELKEVKLCQVPKDYRLLPTTEDSPWGVTYPTAVAEFVNPYRLTSVSDLEKGKKTIWMPANVRGTSANATSDRYRTKENAPTAASYVELVVDNSAKKERLYYRAYLGGENPTDFNLYENKDYNWTLNIKSADYRGDGRVQLLDQTPVVSTNLVSTSNCFMMLPGTNICFNPYKHEAAADGWNTELISNGSIMSDKTISCVKVLWQTKDAGTSGELVMGYVVDDDNHENLVNLTDGGDIDKALVHVKVPVTNGGSALIAAYNAAGVIVWSWHLWISDYIPAPIKDEITDDATRQKAIEAAQQATQEGTVDVYGGISWTASNGAFYKCVIMDRNLGATKAGIQDNSLDGIRTNGFLYQGGRKDPFYSAADGTTNDIATIYKGDGTATSIDATAGGDGKSETPYADLIKNPLIFYKREGNGGTVALTNKRNAWGTADNKKTIYDPCPKGWKVPLGGSDAKNSLFAGFGSTDPSVLLEDAACGTDDIYYYNGTGYVSMRNTSTVNVGSSIAGSGFLYVGVSGETPKTGFTAKSPFFPGVALREKTAVIYRNTNNNTVYLWSSIEASGIPYIYQFQYGKLYLNHKISTAYAFSVRCIQDIAK